MSAKNQGEPWVAWFFSNSRSLCGFLAPVSHVVKTLDVLIHVSVGWAMGLCSVHSGQRPQESATLKVTRSPSWRFHPRCLVKFLKDRSKGDMNSMKIQQVQRWFVEGKDLIPVFLRWWQRLKNAIHSYQLNVGSHDCKDFPAFFLCVQHHNGWGWVNQYT